MYNNGLTAMDMLMMMYMPMCNFCYATIGL